MTIDEALAKIREAEKSWLVWNMDTSEIITVIAWTQQLSRIKELVSHLKALGQYRTRTTMRLFDSAQMTRELVEEVVQEARIDRERVRGRIRILTAWSVASVEELVQVLEHGEYPYPMRKERDNAIVLQHLWELHRDEIGPTVQKRLQSLIGSAALTVEASRNLECYLFALSGDIDGLMEHWRLYHVVKERIAERRRLAQLDPEKYRAEWTHEVFRQRLGIYWGALMDCFCHLQLADQKIISYLIDLVEQPAWHFGFRFDEMMILGKLDAARGTRAAEVIRKVVYDSTPHIIAVRDRILQRLETNGSEWRRCTNCCYGRVHSSDSFGARDCSHCLGLGTVHLSAV
jgi:hypothetical protein